MGRLSLALLCLSSPVLAQDLGPDAGVAITATAPDAGTPAPAVAVGRHFAFLWDTQVPSRGGFDAQVWVTPRWGRVGPYSAVDLRAGVMQGFFFREGFALGAFVDATPTTSGVTQTASIEGRLTLLAQGRVPLSSFAGLALQGSASAGLGGTIGRALVAADATLGRVFVGLNADVQLGPGEWNWFHRQSLGFTYLLTDHFSTGFELQNRLSHDGAGHFGGMAFVIGPSLSYRGEHFWFTVAMLPQVAAVKAEENRGGDPLELTENERFMLRFSLGLIY